MKTFFFTALLLSLFTLTGNAKYENFRQLSIVHSPTNDKEYASLKAVLVVGPQEDGTQAAIVSMNKIADLFQLHGVQVEKFYDTQTDWDKIKMASKRAAFFVYSGHGSTMGEGGKTGGLCLQAMITGKQIKEELQLQRNALVIFQSVCRGAGSSADDEGDIGIREACTRVTDYSKPFFDIGAACYYANNMGNGCILFLKEFLAGKNIRDCFEESTKTTTQTTTINGVKTVKQIASPDTKLELSEEYRYDKNRQISIVSDQMGGTVTRTTYTNGVKKVEQIPSTKEYDIACVAHPDFNLSDLLKTTSILPKPVGNK